MHCHEVFATELRCSPGHVVFRGAGWPLRPLGKIGLQSQVGRVERGIQVCSTTPWLVSFILSEFHSSCDENPFPLSDSHLESVCLESSEP